MSRFNNLEFGGEFEHELTGRSAVKDDQFYLAEATGFFTQGRFEAALRSYSKVLEYNPKSSVAWVGQIRMLIELGEFREAKLWADKALEVFPDESELLAAKAVALARTGDVEAAMTFSDAAMEAQGGTPYVWLARADVLLAGKKKRADFCFEKALGMAPRDWIIHWMASRIQLFYKQFSRAFKLVQQALSLDASQAVLWVEFGRCQLALGLAGQAANSFEHARQLDPQLRLEDADRSDLRRQGFWTRIIGWWRQLCRQ